MKNMFDITTEKFKPKPQGVILSLQLQCHCQKIKMNNTYDKVIIKTLTHNWRK